MASIRMKFGATAVADLFYVKTVSGHTFPLVPSHIDYSDGVFLF
jgi:hypothetical protein